ncbi:hypothetical protein GCM10017083_54450 [Thalassobaculum fulvum]|uniref:Uncharacterized protein n=1 Tax=Thalassobaculum fulvum TaxID=1633335 RepID=A0A918XYY6_9PROT|nr:hypothetical protein GCM10017083_54450 [Thalassobaculum fulvum]
MRPATVELGSLDVSIQAIYDSDWGQSTARAMWRRLVFLVFVVAVLAGPFVLGGAVGWVTTREAGPVLGEDGWLRTGTNLASHGAGFPLVSASELEAAGLSVDEASRILRR